MKVKTANLCRFFIYFLIELDIHDISCQYLYSDGSFISAMDTRTCTEYQIPINLAKSSTLSLLEGNTKKRKFLF